MGIKVISWGEVHRSLEKGNFEGERARHIAFPSDMYTFWGRLLYLSCGEAFRRRKTHLTFLLYNVSDRSKDNQLETP